LVNLSKAEQVVALPAAMTDVLEGGTKQTVTLPVYGVAVLSAVVGQPLLAARFSKRAE
jgi:hypothetical protein